MNISIDTTYWAGTAYPSRDTEFTTGFFCGDLFLWGWCFCALVFWVVFFLANHCLFCGTISLGLPFFDLRPLTYGIFNLLLVSVAMYVPCFKTVTIFNPYCDNWSNSIRNQLLTEDNGHSDKRLVIVLKWHPDGNIIIITLIKFRSINTPRVNRD